MLPNQRYFTLVDGAPQGRQETTSEIFPPKKLKAEDITRFSTELLLRIESFIR